MNLSEVRREITRVRPSGTAPIGWITNNVTCVDAIRAALVELHGRFANGGLPSVELAKADEERLSRRARVEEMVALLGEVA